MNSLHMSVKRITACLLTVMMVATCIPADVFAAEDVAGDITYGLTSSEEELYAGSLASVEDEKSGPENDPDAAVVEYGSGEDDPDIAVMEDDPDISLTDDDFDAVISEDDPDASASDIPGTGFSQESDVKGDQQGVNGTYKPYKDATYKLKYEELEDGTLKITGYEGDATGQLVIPERIAGKKVTVIGNGATRYTDGVFYHCNGFTGDLTIPDSVTVLGDYVFDECRGFTGRLTIGNSVKTIGEMAFGGCTGFSGSLVIPDSVTVIGNHAFAHCSGFNGNLRIGRNVETIGEWAFGSCDNFTGSIVIPDSVRTIGDCAFFYCYNIDAGGFTGSLRIPDGVETIGRQAFFFCQGLDGTLIIPDSVKTIGDDAFEGCDGFRKVINNHSEYEYVFQDFYGVTWINPATGETVTSIKNGIAIRNNFYAPMGSPHFTHNVISAQTYTGRAVKPVVEVYFKNIRLQEKKDYTIKYTNNSNVGTATFTITGKGNYSGKDTDSFEILEKDIAEEDVLLTEPAIAQYTGKEQQAVPKITLNGIKLKKGKDFRIAYYADEYYREYCIPKEPGTYHLKITGIGNFTGERRTTFTIARKGQIPVSKLKVGKIADQPYTGEKIEPGLVIKDGNKKLTKDTHYTLTYDDENIRIGTGTVTITGINPYVGTRTVTFKITGIPMSKLTVNGLKSVSYDGISHKPAVTLTYKTGRKSPGIHVVSATQDEYDAMSLAEQAVVNCIISYEPNTNAGTAAVILTGINGGSGTAKKTFKITPYDMSADPDHRVTVTFDAESYPFAKGGTKPKPVVKFRKVDDTTITLSEGKDYTLSYLNNTTVNGATGTKKPTVKVIGKGNFKGTNATATFAITQADMEATNVKVIVSDVVYQNKPGKWKAKIKVAGPDGKALKAGTDYNSRISYKYAEGDNADKEIPANAILDAGTRVKVTVTAKGKSYTGSATGEYRIIKQDIGKLKASAVSKLYDGADIKLSKGDITWKNGKKKVGDVTYNIDDSSYRNNANVSTKKTKASVKVYGTGNYGGSTTVTFKITRKSILWWWKERLGR